MARNVGVLSDIRVITLLLFVVAAFIGIYVYPPPPADAGLNGNLQYGLDLAEESKEHRQYYPLLTVPNGNNECNSDKSK